MRKLIAGFMTALMALLTATTPVLAATQLGSYPTFLAGSDGTLSTYVVVGESANVADVIGAVDIATRLAEVGKTTVTQSCSGSTSGITGTSKDTVPLAGNLSSVFPGNPQGVLKSAHYSGLKDSTFSWRGTDYSFREQVDLGAVTMTHNLNTNYVNGSEKMSVTNGQFKYQYVFGAALSGTGSTTEPNYTYPINIQLLGKSFSIVGVSANAVTMLQGSIGTATATTPVVYGDYSVYSDLGFSGAAASSGNWARVIIKDKNGNTVDTLTINQGDNKQSAATGLTIMLTTVRALTDGTVVGADLVVGPTTSGVTKTYTQTADVTSTGTANKAFPGETLWGIKVGTNALNSSAVSFAGTGAIAAGDTIDVIYVVNAPTYLAAGEKLSLPNNYGDLGFTGFNTDKFASITVSPVQGVAVYKYSADTTTMQGTFNGLEIASDVPGSIVSSGSNAYNKAYILFNTSLSSSTGLYMIGFYDAVKQKIIVNDTVAAVNTSAAGEYQSKIFNSSDPYTTYTFTLNYGNAGDTTFKLRAILGGAITNGLVSLYAGNTSDYSLFLNYGVQTAASITQAPIFKLGSTVLTAEVDDVNITSEGSNVNAGKKIQDVVDDSGIILGSSDSYGASDKVVMKVPFKALSAVVYFGKAGATGATAGSISYSSYPSIPITSAIAKLDSEVTATEKARNLITVGGPCVNSVTATALGVAFPSCGVSSTIPENKGLIKVVDSPYTEGTGKVVVVVAGWEASNTRVASSVLQQYGSQLAGVTASAVEVTGTVAAPSVTPV